MDTWDAYRSRRNIRDYDDRTIDDAVVDRILDAGRRAPSAFNSQPWDFVVVTGRDALVELATVWQGARHVARSAATIAIITPVQPDPDKARWAEFDLAGVGVDAQQVDPAVEHEVLHDRVVRDDGIERRTGCLHEHRQPQWLMAAATIVERLHRQPDAQVAAVAFEHPDDELSSGRLVELAVVPDLYENFYGITVQRRYEPPPLVGQLLARPDADVLRSPVP